MIKTLVKIFAGILGLVLLLAIAGIIAFKLLADPERVKAQVIALVAEQTGRELTIDGELSLSFVPWLGFKVGAMSLNNEEGFADEPFASVTGAEARVRLLPLFRKQIEVGTLVVSGLTLDLVENRAGQTNWDDFMPGEQAQAAEAAEGGFQARGIANIQINNADIRYRSLASGSDYRLSDASLSAGPLTPGEPFDVDLVFDAAVDDTLAVRTEASARLATDLDAGIVRSERASARLDLSGSAVGEQAVPMTLDIGELALDSEAGRLDLKELVVRVHNLTARTSLQGQDIFATPVFRGPLVVEKFSLRDLLGKLAVEVPDTADRSVLRAVTLKANLEAGSDRLALDGLDARVDDSAMTGRFAMVDFTRRRMSFDLSIDTLDADRYLPPPAKAGAGDEGVAAEGELPVELLRSLDANGTLRIGSLKVAGIQSTNVVATVKARNGELRVNPSQAQLYGGEYRGDVRLAARGKALNIAMNEKVTGVQAGALAGDLFDARRLSGTADVTLRLDGSGPTMAAIRESLSGDLAFAFTDGFVEGVDLWYEIRRAKALFGKGTPPSPSDPARTRYSDMRGTAVVRDGVLRNDDFTAQLPFVKLSGRGAIDLARSTIDYSLTALVLKQPEVVAEESLADLVGARIPVRISGDLLAPSVAPDIGAWARAKAEESVKKKVLGKIFGESPAAAAGEPAEAVPAEQADTEAALKQELENKVKGKLRGLFGGSRDDKQEEPKDEGGGGGG